MGAGGATELEGPDTVGAGVGGGAGCAQAAASASSSIRRMVEC
jgi:hypothetical protein